MENTLRCLVTGGAGFVGSNLVDRLLADGYEVIAYDNFRTGFRENLSAAARLPGFSLVENDILDLPSLMAALSGVNMVFHMAANADVRYGAIYPRRDLEQNTIGTWNVLEAMRQVGVPRIFMASTSAIYGEAKVIPTPEDAPFPVQTSLYAASKLAGEGLVQAFCETYGMQGCIFRFVSMLGERYAHGHIFDFYNKLRTDPSRLHVLGNGLQKKSYLYIQDAIDAIFLAMEHAADRVNIFNVGTDDFCTVKQSLGYICERLAIHPDLEFEGGDRGWVGDNPFIYLKCDRMRALGWTPRTMIRDGILRTLEFMIENPWLLEPRK